MAVGDQGYTERRAADRTRDGPGHVEAKFWHLKKSPLFSTLSREEMQALRHEGEPIDVWWPNRLVPLGRSEEPSLYLVKMGYVRVVGIEESGEESTPMILGPGDMFGTLSEAGGGFAGVCRTVTPACLIRISRSRFERLAAGHPRVAMTLTRISLMGIRRLEVRLAQMAMRPAPARLAAVLLDLDAQAGQAFPEGRVIDLPLSQTDLAKLAGTTREYVTRTLKTFREKGWVEVTRKRMTLKNPDALRTSAGWS